MYPHHPTSNKSYEFLTDSGITYIVEFSNAGFYFPPDCVYCARIEAVSFYPINPLPKGYDPKISITIADIIMTRCISNQGAIVFVCDSLDKKDFGRSRLFETWNDTINKNGDYHFQPSIVEYQEEKAYAGMIVAVSNPDAISFLGEFVSGINYIASK